MTLGEWAFGSKYTQAKQQLSAKQQSTSPSSAANKFGSLLVLSRVSLVRIPQPPLNKRRSCGPGKSSNPRLQENTTLRKPKKIVIGKRGCPLLPIRERFVI